MTVSPYFTLIAPSVDSNKQDKVPLIAQFKYTFLGQTQLFCRALEATMTWQLNNTHDVHQNNVQRGVKNRQNLCFYWISVHENWRSCYNKCHEQFTNNHLNLSMAVNSRADPNTCFFYLLLLPPGAEDRNPDWIHLFSARMQMFPRFKNIKMLFKTLSDHFVTLFSTNRDHQPLSQWYHYLIKHVGD